MVVDREEKQESGTSEERCENGDEIENRKS